MQARLESGEPQRALRRAPLWKSLAFSALVLLPLMGFLLACLAALLVWNSLPGRAREKYSDPDPAPHPEELADPDRRAEAKF